MKNKLLKIIYFDEASVSDFMQIVEGGKLKKTSEIITDTDIDGGIGAKGSINNNKKIFPKLLEILSGVEIDGNIVGDINMIRKNTRIAKNIIENTLLSDFIELIDSDRKRKEKNQRCKGIKIFHKINVRPEKDSFSYIMLMAPFFSMISGEFALDEDGVKVDITKIEEAMERGRGYYEFLANIEGNRKEVILRFNYNAFRNNYTMSDLPKMELTYYTVYVGKIDKSNLKVQNEFGFGNFDEIDYADYTTLNNHGNSEKIDVYDVILAGVESE